MIADYLLAARSGRDRARYQHPGYAAWAIGS